MTAKLRACLESKDWEIAWLRAQISELGDGIKEMPLTNKGGCLVRWRAWMGAKVAHILEKSGKL